MRTADALHDKIRSARAEGVAEKTKDPSGAVAGVIHSMSAHPERPGHVRLVIREHLANKKDKKDGDEQAVGYMGPAEPHMVDHYDHEIVVPEAQAAGHHIGKKVKLSHKLEGY